MRDLPRLAFDRLKRRLSWSLSQKTKESFLSALYRNVNLRVFQQIHATHLHAGRGDFRCHAKTARFALGLDPRHSVDRTFTVALQLIALGTPRAFRISLAGGEFFHMLENLSAGNRF